MKPIKICVITASRAEYGLMRWLMEDINLSSEFELQIIVTGSHLSDKFGYTYKQIELDGFRINEKIPFSLKKSDPISLGSATGNLSSELVKSYKKIKPDLILVMGDRYELLSVITASVLTSTPIAHISGGEITEGAIDDQIRNAMTKISHFHFVANEVYAQRVIQMGEEDWRVSVCGEPGLDNLQRQEIMSFEDLQNDLSLDLSKPTALVTYHPVTLEINDLEIQMNELIKAMDSLSKERGLQYVITYPNADEGSDKIIKLWKNFVAKNQNRLLIKSLGQKRYLSALKNLSLMVGNSSSGLVEAPSFGMPVINIGNRQKGRMRGKNVLDVNYESLDIKKSIEIILDSPRRESYFNPYGDGNSSKKILKYLSHIFKTYTRKEILTKKFIDSEIVKKTENDFFANYSD